MCTTIYFVRHAETKYTPDDFVRPLTEKGKQDALKLVELFKNFKVSKVISSPYLRAVSTVEGIAKNKGLSIETIDNLKERTVSDVYIEDFLLFSKNQWDDFDYCLENGESLRQTQKRGISSLNYILEKYKGESIVIGTHGTILGAILNYFDKKYDYDFWLSIKMPDVFKMVFKDDKHISIEHVEVLD